MVTRDEAIKAWEKLIKRVDVSYYIGDKDTNILNDFIYTGSDSSSTQTIGIDLDNDGVIDTTLRVGK